MQAPPDEHGYAPPRKPSYLWLWILLGVFVLCGCGALVVLPALLFPVFSQARQAAIKAQCLSNVKVLGAATAMYAGDYDDRLPPSDKWEDSIGQYPRTEAAFNCPAVRRSGGENGYAAALNLSRKKMGDIADPRSEIWLYETNDLQHNAAGDPAKEPWPNRHGPGRTVGFADGSAKFVKP